MLLVASRHRIVSWSDTADTEAVYWWDAVMDEVLQRIIRIEADSSAGFGICAAVISLTYQE